MTLPASGTISFNNINVELGVSGTTQADINQSSYRTLAGVPSGTIALSNFYGKANQFAFTLAGGTNVNLRSAAVSAGWNQSSSVACTISANVVSSSTGTPALTINGAWPGGVSVTVNSGVSIIGRGGDGATGLTTGIMPGRPGFAGGTGLSVSSPVTITNGGVIAGGGGGGGSASTTSGCYPGSYIAQGGGGGGGGFGAAGGNGGYPPRTPAVAGTLTAGGNGCSGTDSIFGGSIPGGTGGAANVAGGDGPQNSRQGTGGGGGGVGAAGGRGSYATGANPPEKFYSPGGAAGSCTSGNSNITWAATGTRYGALN